MRLLLVEDNQRLNYSLKMSLMDEGFAVDTALNGKEGQHYVEVAPYDAIILDVMLPNQDGLELCSALRRQHINTPIIMLTARDAIEDRVRGLDSGADDYLIKPFDISELCARLRALLRREAPYKGGLLEVGDLTADPVTRRVMRRGQRIELTLKEFAFLEYFMRNPGHVITREMALDHIWNYGFDGTSNVVDVYIRRLRRKIDDPFEEKVFETVHGAGYRLRESSRDRAYL